MKGVVLVNCGQLGLDWSAISLSGYLEAMNAHSDDGAPTEVSPGLKSFLKAHGVTGNA